MGDFKLYLDNLVQKYNNPNFIDNDPISVPHRFSKKQDIEIMGFFSATFAWGLRKTIINKSLELARRMDNSPLDFVLNHAESDLKGLLGFKHRTFNDTDLLYTVEFLKMHYSNFESLEDAFIAENITSHLDIKQSLIHFHKYFFSLEDYPLRTKKHIPTPARNSACKRLCMFLRWMVRQDNNGVDFGIWKRISPSQLVIPLDLHVIRTAQKLNLISSDKANWQTAEQITNVLRNLDKQDPIKYDFALFASSIEREF